MNIIKLVSLVLSVIALVISSSTLYGTYKLEKKMNDIGKTFGVVESTLEETTEGSKYDSEQ